MENVMTSSRSSGSELATPTPLLKLHDVGEFDGGEPALNDWLRRRALQNESRFSRTYVVCDGTKVVAHHRLSAGSVEWTEAPGRIRRNAPDAIPVSILGGLAVSRDDSGQGVGADILGDALRRIAIASQSIGIGAVLVQAKNESAKRFYKAFAEFIEQPVDSRTLFLPIETAVTAFN